MNRLLHVTGSLILVALFGVGLRSVNKFENWLQLGAWLSSSNTTDLQKWVHHCSDGSSSPRAAGATKQSCQNEQKVIKGFVMIWWEGRYFFWMCAVLYIPLWKS